jgi:hypothetical protein
VGGGIMVEGMGEVRWGGVVEVLFDDGVWYRCALTQSLKTKRETLPSGN